MNKRFLVDLNVLLDVLLDRHPHAPAAAAFWARVEGGQAVGFLAAHGLTTIHYLARRARGARFAREAAELLLSVFSVAPVDGKTLRQALTMSLPDFEDAVSAACAAAARCNAIVTRDPAGFRGSPVPAIDPKTALALMSTSSDS